MTMVELRDVRVQRGEWRGHFSLEVGKGEWLSIVGPSGSGKSTLLEVVAGFLREDSGAVALDGTEVTGLPPAARGVGYVFQNNALFPHLSLERNLLLALHDSRENRTQRRERVRAMCDSIRLPQSYLQRFPGEISGGELARFNLARALLRPCRVLLLDEPFSSLDEELRFEMNMLVRSLHEERCLTTLCVTHHQEDAFQFADRVLVMCGGERVALASPRTLARFPTNEAVARFLRTGTPYAHDGQLYFLRPDDLVADRALAAGFAETVTISFSKFRWSTAGTHDTVVDLDTGAAFRTRPLDAFAGVLFFDASSTPRIPEGNDFARKK